MQASDATPAANSSPVQLSQCNEKLVLLRSALEGVKSNQQDATLTLQLAGEAFDAVEKGKHGELARRYCLILDRARLLVQEDDHAAAAGCSRWCRSTSPPSSPSFATIQSDLKSLIAEARSGGGDVNILSPQDSGPELKTGLSDTIDNLESWKTVTSASTPLKSSTATEGSSYTFYDGKRLRKPSRQETVTAVTLTVPEDADWKTHSGRAWIYISRLFGSDKFLMYDMLSGFEQQSDGAKNLSPITVLHLDAKGILWSGHRSGAVA